MLQNCWHPAIKLLASAKAVSEGDGAGHEARTATHREPTGALTGHFTGHQDLCDEPRDAASTRVRSDTTTGVGYPQTVDNHVDIRSSSIRPFPVLA